MVYFQCEDCGDALKKPKLKGHFNACSASAFSCIDCLQVFDRRTVQSHVSCVTEHEKYALGATKPGGAQVMREANARREGGAGDGGDVGDVVGDEFLSTRAPWACSCCGVKCTSEDTLLGHARGKKHKSKARSARARAAGGGEGEGEGGAGEAAAEAAAEPSKKDDDGGVGKKAEKKEKKEKTEKKEKKSKREKKDSASDDEPKAKKAKKDKKDKKKCWIF